MKNKPKLETATRFMRLENSLTKKEVKDPNALTASIGIKKYGDKKFEKLSYKKNPEI